MNRANIITIFDRRNYGNRLQNYAMTETLARLGFAPVVTLRSRENVASGLMAQAKTSLGAIWHGKAVRQMRFDEFSSKETPFHWTKPDAIKRLDGVFVIGSDQVWNPYFSMGRRMDGFQFAAGVNPSRKVAYAPSFGIALEDMPNDVREYYSIGLRSVEHLSAREVSGQEIIKALTGRDAPLVLDPTMLLSAEDWTMIAHAPSVGPMSKRYCLKYMLGDDVRSSMIDELAGSSDLEVIDLRDPGFPVGPAEFLYLINNSEFVCTDSFHAAVFSIIFHKPFIVFERRSHHKDMSSRLRTLEMTIPLMNWLYVDDPANELSVKEQDWVAVDKELRIAKEYSLKFLRKSVYAAASEAMNE